jgi:hypothetical protein
MKIVAKYHRYVEFVVPAGVVLLSKKENEKAQNSNTENIPFSWRVDGDVLFYIDADGKEQEVEGQDDCCDEPDDVYCVHQRWICGVVCRKCNTTLPKHTEEEHLDPTHSVHKCPQHTR